MTPIEFLDYPISHSLLGVAIWSVVAAAAYYSWPTRDTSRHWQASAMVGLAVFSHYPLDVVVHAADLPLFGNESTKLGFGLWNSPAATLALELLVLGVGLAYYVVKRSHRHPLRAGRMTVLVLTVLAAYLANLYGPLPPSMTTVAMSAIVLYLAMGALAAWADRRASPAELAEQGLSQR